MIDKNYDEFLETTGASRNLVEDINNFLLDSNCLLYTSDAADD